MSCRESTHGRRLRVVAVGVLALSLASGAGTLAIATAQTAACPAGSGIHHRLGCGGPANCITGLTRPRPTDGRGGDAARRGGAGNAPRLLPGPRDRHPRRRGRRGGGCRGSAGPGRPLPPRSGLIDKAGWWGTDLRIGGDGGLPRRECEGIHERGVAFAGLVSKVDPVAAEFDISQTVGELRRGDVRASLITPGLPAHVRRASWAHYPAWADTS